MKSKNTHIALLLLKSTLVLLLALVITKVNAQYFNVYNDGVALKLEVGSSLYFDSTSYTNKTNGSDGSIDNEGNMYIEGDWTNNAAAGVVFINRNANGTVHFRGDSTQTIDGTRTTTFENLTINNSTATVGDVTLATNDYIVERTFTMTEGSVDMGSRTLTLGTSVANIGTLVYTAGMLYKGTFNRWFNTSIIADGAMAGLFPVGDSTNYQPFYTYYPTTGPSVGGTYSVSKIRDVGARTVNFPDGAFTVERRRRDNWITNTANGLTVGVNNLVLRAGGTGFDSIANVNDLRLTLAGSVIGTAGTNGGTILNPIVRRIDLPAIGPAPVIDTFYIASVDEASSPLPIELLSFNAIENKDVVDLTWITATEINNDFFMVEKTKDGETYEEVAMVKAVGNSNTLQNYATVDKHPYHGISYYRLKQTDFDGKYTYSDIVAVEFHGKEEKRDIDFTVFPNPSDGLNINVKSNINYYPKKGILVVVVDLLGRQYYSEVVITSDSGSFYTAIDPHKRIPVGVYVIMGTSNNDMYSEILIVE